MRLTTRRALQTESNCCDILGSFYEQKADTAWCCLGRGKLMGTPLRKRGQLTKAELQHLWMLTCGFTSPRALNQISCNAAAPAFIFHGHTSPGRWVPQPLAISSLLGTGDSPSSQTHPAATQGQQCLLLTGPLRLTQEPFNVRLIMARE